MDEVVGEPRWWRRGAFWAGVMLLAMVGLVVADRWALCQQFLFKYFDQDQSLLWYAAREFLHGRFHEPCFYGQDYSSCIESYLAAPLLIFGAPYWVALPMVTVVLGLLPFFLVAGVAWRRGQWVVAGLALLVPVVLPIRYAMVTGMPRGFVPGLALAIVPALWMAARGKSAEEAGKRGFGMRFFWMGVLGVISLMFTANAAVLLLAAGIYGIARYGKRWRFWVAGSVGLVVASVYPVLVYCFYHVWHDDYRIQYRGFTFPWTIENFARFRSRWPIVFGDLVPMGVSADWAATFLVCCGAVILTWLLVRRRWGLAAAVAGCAGLVVCSCAYSRVFYGSASVFYALSRMFLALPVVMVWIVVAAGPMRKRWKEWVSVVLVGLIVGVGVWVVVVRRAELPGAIELAIEQNKPSSSPLYVMKVEELEPLAKGVQKAADQSHAEMVLFGGEEYRKFDYCLPLLTTCETLFTRFERRTWRMYEENHPRYEKILTMDRRVDAAAEVAGYPVSVVASPGGPLVFVIETKGESVVEMARRMGLPMRQFDETK